VACAWDTDHDVFYVTASYRESHQTPIVHAAAVRPWGDWIPCAWPHDGLQHDKGSADQLAGLYAAQGLNMLPEHATHEEGGNGVEAGLIEIYDRMKTGRFRVFRTLGDWFAEKRGYHRKNGLIAKQRDDLLDATRCEGSRGPSRKRRRSRCRRRAAGVMPSRGADASCQQADTGPRRAVEGASAVHRKTYFIVHRS
jgi:Terminase RNaseH-like domain